MEKETRAEYHQRLTSISRRDLLRISGAVGLAGLLPVLTPRAYAQGADAPQRGGVLRIRQLGDPPSLDLLANTTSRVPLSAGPCCNGLLRYDSTDPDKIVTDLADSFEMAEDGLSYTFHLHDGVKFHDGQPCTAEDVKFTFDTIRNPPEGVVSARRGVFEAVTNIQIVDPLTVRFDLSRPSPSLIANLASGWMLVQPKHLLEQGPITNTIMGTGPFRFKEWKRGVSLELERNPDYFKPEKPHLDGIMHYYVPDESTAYAYFRSGQIDLMLAYPARIKEWEAQLGETGKIVGNPYSTACFSVTMNTRNAPWNDIRVRKAVALAINREEFVQSVLLGYAETTGWSMPGKWALPKERLEQIAGYAPYQDAHADEARALLAEAGFPDGLKDTMLVRRTDLFQPVAIFLQAQLKKVGIELALDFQETASFYERIRSGTGWAINAGGISYPLNDPDMMYGGNVTCDGAGNESGICDPEIDRLFQEQSQQIDEAARIALVNDMETRVLETYGVYPLAYYKQFKVVRNTVQNYVLHPSEDNGTRFEDVWIRPE